MVISKTNIKAQVELNHARDVIAASYAYVNMKWVSIAYLAKMYHVSQNRMIEYFIEAISKGYLTDEGMCEKLSEKSIAEYEKNNDVFSHELRAKYSNAFESRLSNLSSASQILALA